MRSEFQGLENRAQRRQAERSGIALIIVLGILSVLTIMAVSFAISMRVERMAARNAADMVRAREAVQVALVRAIEDLDRDLRTNSTLFADHWRWVNYKPDDGLLATISNAVPYLFEGEVGNYIPVDRLRGRRLRMLPSPGVKMAGRSGSSIIDSNAMWLASQLTPAAYRRIDKLYLPPSKARQDGNRVGGNDANELTVSGISFDVGDRYRLRYPQWQNLYTPSTTLAKTNGESVLYGRIAYIVLDASGLLDVGITNAAGTVEEKDRKRGRSPSEIVLDKNILMSFMDPRSLLTGRAYAKRFESVADMYAVGQARQYTGGKAFNNWPVNEFTYSLDPGGFWDRDTQGMLGRLYIGGDDTNRWSRREDIIDAFYRSLVKMTPPSGSFSSSVAREMATNAWDALVAYVGKGYVTSNEYNAVNFKAVPMFNELVVSNRIATTTHIDPDTGATTVEVSFNCKQFFEVWYPFVEATNHRWQIFFHTRWESTDGTYASELGLPRNVIMSNEVQFLPGQFYVEELPVAFSNTFSAFTNDADLKIRVTVLSNSIALKTTNSTVIVETAHIPPLVFTNRLAIGVTSTNEFSLEVVDPRWNCYPTLWAVTNQSSLGDTNWLTRRFMRPSTDPWTQDGYPRPDGDPWLTVPNRPLDTAGEVGNIAYFVWRTFRLGDFDTGTNYHDVLDRFYVNPEEQGMRIRELRGTAPPGSLDEMRVRFTGRGVSNSYCYAADLGPGGDNDLDYPFQVKSGWRHGWLSGSFYAPSKNDKTNYGFRVKADGAYFCLLVDNKMIVTQLMSSTLDAHGYIALPRPGFYRVDLYWWQPVGLNNSIEVTATNSTAKPSTAAKWALLGDTARGGFYVEPGVARRGVVNLNTDDEMVLASAFQKLPASDYANDYYNANDLRRIEQEDAKKVAKYLRRATTNDLLKLLPTRPEIASPQYEKPSHLALASNLFNVGYVFEKGPPPIDIEIHREAAVRNSIGLFGVRNGLYLIILVGQSVYDENANGVVDEDEVRAEQRAVALVWRDPLPPGKAPGVHNGGVEDGFNRSFVRFFKWILE